MDAGLKAKLVDKMQEFLDENADDIGSIYGVWQDTSMARRNAHLMAEAASLIVDAQTLQYVLAQEEGGKHNERS